MRWNGYQWRAKAFLLYGRPVAMINIRAVEALDAAEWTALRVALWPDDTVTHAAEVQRFLSRAAGTAGAMPEAVMVAADSDDISARLLGFVEVSRRGYAPGCETSPVGFLEGWYVVPERRRQGVGRALVDAAEDWARRLGCTEFGSDAHADNMLSATAHARLGFEEVEVIRCFRKALA